ncbi:D-serine dehydratase [compost metagenome]
MQRLIDGYYTVDDATLYRLLAQMQACEGHELEPSALAGVPGMVQVLQEQQGYRQRLGLSDTRMAQATHLVWGTGGSMVPRTEMDAYLAKGRVELAGQ